MKNRKRKHRRVVFVRSVIAIYKKYVLKNRYNKMGYKIKRNVLFICEIAIFIYILP